MADYSQSAIRIAHTPGPSPSYPPELARRLRESFAGPWGGNLSIWQDGPMRPWGYPMGSSGGAFAGGASGTVNDRRGGRDLPLIYTEIDLRGFRVLSRFLCDTNSFAIGFLNRLIDYHIRKGFKWQACRRGVRKAAYPTTDAQHDPLLVKGQSILDQWRDANAWPSKSREAFKRWCRDGEVFGRLFFGGNGRLSPFRFVEPEQVGSPDGATDGPYSFGIECDPDDMQTRWAYHLWDMESGMTAGEWVDAERMVHLTANVDSTVKRGLPDFFPVQEQLDGVRRLLRNIIETAITQSAVPWMEKFPTATAGQIRDLIGSVAAERQQNGIGSYPGGSGPYGQLWQGGNLPPNSIPRMEGNREIVPGPMSAGVPNYIEGEQACLRGASARWGMPEYFSGDSSSGTYNNSIVAGSTFDLAIEGGQLLYGSGFERPVAMLALDLAAEAGLLTREERAQLDVEITAPAVVTNEPEKDTQRRKILFDSGVLDGTTWTLEEGYDPQHVAENKKAEAAANPQPQLGQQPGQEPGDQPGNLAPKQPGAAPSVATESADASGHQHKGPGAGGGQFTKGSSGGGGSKTKPAAKPAASFGQPGNDNPISGTTRDEQISQLAALVGKGDDESDPMGLRTAGPPAIDMHAFTASVQSAVDAAPNASAGLGLTMPELYAAVGEKYGLSKHDFNRAMAAVGDSKAVRMGGWGESLDEIPDPQLGTMTSSKVMYFAHPNPGAERLTTKSKEPAAAAVDTPSPASDASGSPAAVGKSIADKIISAMDDVRAAAHAVKGDDAKINAAEVAYEPHRKEIDHLLSLVDRMTDRADLDAIAKALGRGATGEGQDDEFVRKLIKREAHARFGSFLRAFA